MEIMNYLKSIIIIKRFGEFPSFWQDIKQWKYWKEILRLFLINENNNEYGNNPDNVKQIYEYGPNGKYKTGWGLAKDVIESKKQKFNLCSGKIIEGLSLCSANGLLDPNHLEIIQFRLMMEELNGKMLDIDKTLDKIHSNPNRPPSPSPIYDGNGNKINGLKQRIINDINRKRRSVMKVIVKKNPLVAVYIKIF